MKKFIFLFLCIFLISQNFSQTAIKIRPPFKTSPDTLTQQQINFKLHEAGDYLRIAGNQKNGAIVAILFGSVSSVLLSLVQNNSGNKNDANFSNGIVFFPILLGGITGLVLEICGNFNIGTAGDILLGIKGKYQKDEEEEYTETEIIEKDTLPHHPMKGFFGSINGGVVFPFGNLSNGEYTNNPLIHLVGTNNTPGWATGWNVGGNAGYMFNNNFATRIDFSYNNFSNTIQNVTGGSFTIAGLGADFMIGNFKQNIPTIIYGFLGPKMFFKSISDLNPSAVLVGIESTKIPYSEMEFGFEIGAGLDFKISKHLGIILETQYNIGLGNVPVTQKIPIKTGIMFTP